MQLKKILCIHLKQIGDVLMTTPSIKELKKKHPNTEIHFLTQKPADQIFDYNPYVDKIICLKRAPSSFEFIKLFFRMKKENYDCVIDFYGKPKTAFLVWLLRIKTRIGFNFRGRSFFYNKLTDLANTPRYSPLHKIQLLEHLIDDVPQKLHIDFFIDISDRENIRNLLAGLKIDHGHPIVTISPVSRRDYKVWPSKKFAKLCDQLVKIYNAQIIFIWGPNEENWIRNVSEFMTEKFLKLDRILSLRETVALFEAVDLHIGNDNGPMHFAIAASTPSIAIFGRPNPVAWTPPAQEKHLFVEYDPGCKSNCFYPKCNLECIKEIEVNDVWKKVEFQMNRLGFSNLNTQQNESEA